MFPLASATPKQPNRSRPQRPGDGNAYDDAPLLKGAAERLLAALLKSLGTMAGPATIVEGALVGYRRVALRDHLAMQRPGTVSSALDCAGVGCTVLAGLDAALVHAVVELLCGGTGGECRPDEMRPATSIDMQYSHTLAALAAAAIAAEWQERGFTGVKPVRIEGAPQADVCGAATREVGVVTLAIAIFGLRGLLTLALPPTALQAFAGEVETMAPPPDADPLWSTQLRQELARAAVTVDVLLDAMPLSLRQLSELKPGQVLALPSEARTRASLVCDGRTLYRGEIGQDENRYSLRIDEVALPSIALATPSAETFLRLRKSPLQDLTKA